MKFLERGLIMLAIIGYYLAVWNKKPDLSILFISAAGFGILYLFGMPFLLRPDGEPLITDRKYYWQDLPVILSFGIISAYCVFSIVYHCQGNMTSLAIIENCGLLLSGILLISIWRLHKTRNTIYKNMLKRIGILGVFIAVSLLMYKIHPIKATSSF